MGQDPRFEQIRGCEPVMVGDLSFADMRVGNDMVEINRHDGKITHIVVNNAGIKDLMKTNGQDKFDFENGREYPPTRAWGVPLLIDPRARWRYSIYARYRKAA